MPSGVYVHADFESGAFAPLAALAANTGSVQTAHSCFGNAVIDTDTPSQGVKCARIDLGGACTSPYQRVNLQKAVPVLQSAMAGQDYWYPFAFRVPPGYTEGQMGTLVFEPALIGPQFPIFNINFRSDAIWASLAAGEYDPNAAHHLPFQSNWYFRNTVGGAQYNLPDMLIHDPAAGPVETYPDWHWFVVHIHWLDWAAMQSNPAISGLIEIWHTTKSSGVWPGSPQIESSLWGVKFPTMETPLGGGFYPGNPVDVWASYRPSALTANSYWFDDIYGIVGFDFTNASSVFSGGGSPPPAAPQLQSDTGTDATPIILLNWGTPLVPGSLPVKDFTVKILSGGQPGPPPPPVTTGWAAATAYTQTPPPFTPIRTVNVATEGALIAALAGWADGDLIVATAPFVCNSGQFLFTGILPATGVKVDLTAGVTFAYTPGGGSPGVYVESCQHLQIFGGINTLGALRLDNVDDVLWWNGVSHNTDESAIQLYPANGDVTNCDLFFEVYHWGLNLALDPHAEKGTGLHGCNVSDSAHNLTGGRLAIWAHDGAAGAGMQYGSIGHTTSGVTIYLKADRMSKISQSQMAGNALNVWGTGTIGATVAYLEANDCQGYAVSVGVESIPSFYSGIDVVYGRATNCDINPTWPPPAFMPGPTYQDIASF